MSEKKEVEGLVTYRYRGTERRMYPEVAEYLRTLRRVEWDYEDATRDASYAYEVAEREARRAAEDEGRRWDPYARGGEDARRHREYTDAQDTAVRAARERRNEALQSTKEGLINSSHSEVKWIAENVLFSEQGSEIEGYARDILAILPATTEEIWEEAKDNRGMCEVFDRYFEEADAAGVFNDGKISPAARQMAALRSWMRRNYGDRYVRDITSHLKPVLKAMEEDADRRVAEAKAEWQRLDEAYAENTRRNRSEGARRAAETRRRNAEAREEIPTDISDAEREALTAKLEPAGNLA